jgi:SLT domain-containing protein/cell wall-associated NlpC family hydrolase
MADESTVAGQGPLLGWNKAQDAISKLAKNVESLNKGLETAASKLKTVGGGAAGLWQGWHSGGSGSQSGARGFGMLANDVWNNTSNYGHGRPNGGAGAPSTAPRAGGQQQRMTTSANGGGVTFSGQTGQGGGAANNGGQGGSGSGGSGSGGSSQGGGSGNNGGRKSPYSFKGGLKDFHAWAAKQMDDKVLMDSVVYQSGQISSQSYGATAKQAFTNNFGAQSTMDAGLAYQTLGQSTAGSPGSANFASAWNYAKSSGLLNPGISEAQRVQGMAGAWTAQSYYANQAVGIQTIKNGKRQDPRQIAQQVMQRWSSLKNIKNKDQIHDTLSDGSAMMQSLARTMPAGTLQQVKSELTGMLNAQIKGASEQQYVSTMNKAADGNKSARAQLKKWNIGDSDAQAIQDRAGTLRNQDVNTLQPFNDGLKTATNYLDKFSTAVQSFLKSTHLDTPIGWAGGAGSMVGSAVGSAVGNYGMMRGLGMVGRLGGFGGGSGGGLLGAGRAALGGGTGPAAGFGALGGALDLSGAALGAAGAFGVAALGTHHFGSQIVDKVSKKGGTGNKWGHVGVDAATGALTGAAIGSVVPVIGTGIGAAVGGGIGAVTGMFSNNVFGGGSSGGAAAATGSKTSGAVATGTSGAGKTAAAVIKIAMKYLGVKYVWGGASPKGFDCSGLMQFSFKQIGVSLPRTAAQQQKAGKSVKLGQERAGDLLFNGNPAHHVVMCIGNGKVIEAPHTGSSVRIRAYQPGEFTNAVRILGAVGNLGDLTDGGADTAGSDSNRLSSMGFGGDVGSYGSVEEVDAIAAGIASVGAANVGSGVGAGQGGSSTKSTDNGSVPGSMPTGNLKGWIKSALGILHQDTSSNEKYVNSMAMHESGGNPHAQNNWDSNAKAGHPSKGIMQTIDSTFKAYSLAGHKNIWNPVDNIIAGVRYADSRYGSLANVPGIKSMANGGSYKGYAVGSANIDVDQTARVHKGEMIIPAHQADAIRKALSSNTPLAGGIGGLNTSGGKATLNFHAGAVTVQVSGAMDQTSARDAANKFMTALAEDNRINLIAAGN